MKNKSLRLFELTLSPETPIKLPQSVGSLFHGILMEQVPTEQAELLHTQERRGYSQGVYYDKDAKCLKWRIGTLTEELGNCFEDVLSSLPSTVHVKQKGINVHIDGMKCLDYTSYAELGDRFLGSGKKYASIQMQLATSATFKHDGRYSIFPEVEDMVSNVLNRWNRFSDAEVIQVEDAAKEIADNMHIGGYDLALHPYALEHTRIPAFRGTVTLRLHGNVILSRLAAMLFYFANFSGIGIKTALGMGRVITRIEERL